MTLLVLGTALLVLATALERPDAGYLVGSLDEGALRTVLSSAPLDGRGSMACGLEGAAGAAAHSERCKRTVLYACNLYYCGSLVPSCLDGTGTISSILP